jgi:hypothetical protein
VRADDVLVEHHQVLRGLLRDLQATPDPDARRRLRDRFLFELEVHVQIEDEIFYPAVADVSPLLSIAHAEHRQIDEQLATVLRTSPRAPGLPDRGADAGQHPGAPRLGGGAADVPAVARPR